jgi:general secretion pathway protein E
MFRIDSDRSPAALSGARRLELEDLLPALVDEGLIRPGDADTVRLQARLGSSPQHPLITLAQRTLISARDGRPLTLEALTEWMAGRFGLPYVRIDPLKIEFAHIGEVMSSQYATRHGILPIEVGPRRVLVASAEPLDTVWIDELSGLLRREVQRVIANPQDIARYIIEFFSLARSVRDAQRRGGAGIASNFEQLVEMGKGGRNVDANDQHVVTIVDWLWQYAFEQRASDIHLEPRRDMGIVRFRIDGVLHTVYQVPASVMAAITSRIKLLGRMDVVEKRRPQDGRIKTRTTEGREVELRLSTLPTAFGEKLVMRVFDPEVLQRGFADLGFSADDLERWGEMTAHPNGIVLVTGPTGSGKTTTLYSTLRELATDEVNVCTVEDPIEMVEPAFNQLQVQPNLDLGFAEGIRALMRQDPDIIMVGEIRDVATAEMAVQAALTGHLVLATLHTNDAPSAVSRLIEIGVPAFLLKATLIGVLAQRLVRTLCSNCKTPVESTDDSPWRALTRGSHVRAPTTTWRAVGCIECRNTGFKGRAGLYELLTVNDGLRTLITDSPDVRVLRDAAVRDGMRPLRIAGALKVAAGVTTIEEVLRNAPPTD